MSTFATRRLGILLLLAVAAGCGTSHATDVAIDDLVRSTTATAALGTGDVFEVRVFREADLSGLFQVGSDGTIDYPLLGTLRVEGLTSTEVAAGIRDGLAKGYIRVPYVTVTVKEFQSRRVYVLGQVEKPGTFRYEEGMSIVQVITLAGGFGKLARPNAVVVTRSDDGKDTRTVVPVADISEGKEKNFLVRPGDIIFVPESYL